MGCDQRSHRYRYIEGSTSNEFEVVGGTVQTHRNFRSRSKCVGKLSRNPTRSQKIKNECGGCQASILTSTTLSDKAMLKIN
jgi:hypothetical protein